jgi:hypothetical protein
VILDGDQQRWTILDVKLATLGARWRCTARNVVIAFGLDDTITVLKATDGGSAWRTWRTGIRARIQPIQTKISTTGETPSTSASFRIFVAENLELDHTYCIRGADGVLYTITRVTGADRIGELQVIEVAVTW